MEYLCVHYDYMRLEIISLSHEDMDKAKTFPKTFQKNIERNILNLIGREKYNFPNEEESNWEEVEKLEKQKRQL